MPNRSLPRLDCSFDGVPFGAVFDNGESQQLPSRAMNYAPIYVPGRGVVVQTDGTTGLEEYSITGFTTNTNYQALQGKVGKRATLTLSFGAGSPSQFTLLLVRVAGGQRPAYSGNNSDPPDERRVQLTFIEV